MLLDFAPLFNRLRATLPWRPAGLPPAALLADPRPLAHPQAPLPAWVAADPVAQTYRALLGDLPWAQFPERPSARPYPGPHPAPRAPFVAAYLVKLHEGKRSMPTLRTFLVKHPALVYLLGFPRVPDPTAPHGFDVAASVPPRRQFNRVLRTLSNEALQFLLDGSVRLVGAALPPQVAATLGDVVAGDTKHILAWVKENNPKQYVKEGRYDKTRQPKGDRDCKLGCKKRHNRSPEVDDDSEPLPTPTTNPQPASQRLDTGEYYWGYASGVVATKIADWGELVLAERTRPFNESDVSYFFPLMEATKRRLGHRPRYGAWDAAFDAHYVYEYFHTAGGFAAVPLVPHGKGGPRSFDRAGLPLCAAGLAMPLQFSYLHRTDLIPHQRGKHRCPLLFPQPSGEVCPITDAHFAKGGCTTTIAMSIGARIRWQLNREDPLYIQIFNQRTATERINSLAKELGIERPLLRNQRSITNQNTLIYVLLNLRLLQRIRAKQAAPAPPEVGPVPTALAQTA